MAGIEVTTMDLTPDDARDFLNSVVRNRKINQTTVNKYRNDMLAHRWAFAGDPIRFNTEMNMIDGSHRMTALSLCPPGMKIPFVVMTGLPDDSQFVMDQGRIRNAGQQLQMRGVKNASLVSAGVRLYLAWRDGWLFKDGKLIQEHITVSVIEDWVERNSNLIAEISSSVGTLRNVEAPGSIAYCAALIFHQIDPVRCEEYFDILQKGSGSATHPITALDRRLRRTRRERIALPQKELLGMFIQTWNAWRSGREMTKFQLPKGGTWTKDTFPVAAEW